MSQEHVEIVRRWAEAIERGELAAGHDGLRRWWRDLEARNFS